MNNLLLTAVMIASMQQGMTLTGTATVRPCLPQAATNVVCLQVGTEVWGTSSQQHYEIGDKVTVTFTLHHVESNDGDTFRVEEISIP